MKIASLVLAALILFQVCPVIGQEMIYTNKDLEKYIDKKSQEKSVSTSAPQSASQVKFAGKKVSIDVSDANLSGVLSLLSDIARQDGFVLSVDPRTQGKITLKMTNVPWDQLLDFLIENYHLSKVVKDKMIMIAPGN